jgi:hypothetical protein
MSSVQSRSSVLLCQHLPTKTLASQLCGRVCLGSKHASVFSKFLDLLAPTSRNFCATSSFQNVRFDIV